MAVKNSLRRTLHGILLSIVLRKILVVIGNFRELTSFKSLDYPNSSGYTNTGPEEIHPTEIGDLHKEYYYPWDSHQIKILPNSRHSSIKSYQDCSSSQKITVFYQFATEHIFNLPNMIQPYHQHFTMLRKTYQGRIFPYITFLYKNTYIRKYNSTSANF